MSFTYDKRIVIYPTYLNKKRTEGNGRKIPLEKACEDPTVNEILDACTFLKLEAEIEADKKYSREWWTQGRVRVKLFKDDGSLVNSEFPTRRSIFLKVAELVPKHPDRREKEKQQHQSQGGKQSKQDAKKKGKKPGKKK